MRVKKEDAWFILIAIPLFFYASTSDASAFVLPKYDFSYVSDVNVTAFADYMVDSNNDGLNDSLRISVELNSSKDGYFIAFSIEDGSNLLTKGMAKNLGSSFANISFDSYLLHSTKFNYSVKIYEGNILKFRKDSIETKEYDNYERGIFLEDVFDYKDGNSIAVNFIVNSTIDIQSDVFVIMKYSGGEIFSYGDADIKKGDNIIKVKFDNESLKRTHYSGNFTIQYAKIAGKLINVSHTTQHYDYKDFAEGPYISNVSDSINNGNLHFSIESYADFSGDYSFEASLYDLYDGLTGSSNWTVQLSNGKNTMELDFNSSAIYSKKSNGPYIADIRLVKNGSVEDEIKNYRTSDYNFTDFIASGLPDLRVSISLSDGYHYGINNLTANVTVINKGEKAFNVFLDVFGNSSAIKEYQPNYLSYLDEGNQNTYSSSSYIFEIINASDFEINAIADINGIVEESNETNNIDSKIIRINKKPQLVPLGNSSVSETGIIKVNLSATDINGDNLDYSINSTLFRKNRSIFEWKTSYLDAGNYTFKATASDGYLNDSVVFYVEVFDAPAIFPDDNSSKFYIKDRNGMRIAWFSNQGNAAIKGSVYESSENNLEADNAFSVKYKSRNIMSVADNGSMHIAGTLHQNLNYLPYNPENQFTIRDSNEGVALYLNSSGSLFMKGNFTQNGIP